jgi:hypothetical protein
MMRDGSEGLPAGVQYAIDNTLLLNVDGVNKWVRESIAIANAPKYLDKISKIYVMKVNTERPLSQDVVKKIKSAYQKQQDKRLIRLLIEHPEVFPVKDSYVGFLRKKHKAIDENPKTIRRIAKRLYSQGFKRMMQEATRPIETNRQLGNMFQEWLHKLGYRIVDEERMLKSKSGILILEGGDKARANFAKKRLGCRLRKGIDLVIKKDKRYIIGEAKFLTTPGGEQDGGFYDAESFVRGRSGKALRIAVIDGYIWLKTLRGIHEKIRGSDANVMTALLLKKFVRSL